VVQQTGPIGDEDLLVLEYHEGEFMCEWISGSVVYAGEQVYYILEGNEFPSVFNLGNYSISSIGNGWTSPAE
jgi:hypothetical protein